MLSDMSSSFRDTFSKSFGQVVGMDDRAERDAKVLEDNHPQKKREDSNNVLPAAVLSAIKVLAVAVADAVEEEITSTPKTSILAKSAAESTQALKDKPVKPESSRSNGTEIDPPKDESAKLETTEVEPQNFKSANKKPAKTEVPKIEHAKLEVREAKPTKLENTNPELAASGSFLMETLMAELPEIEIANETSEAEPARIEPPEIEPPKTTVTKFPSVIPNDRSEGKVPTDNKSSISRKTNKGDEDSEESLSGQTRVSTYLKGLNEEKDGVRESYFGLYDFYDDDHNEDDLENSAPGSSDSGSSVCLNNLYELDHSLIDDNVSLASEPISESSETSSGIIALLTDGTIGKSRDSLGCGGAVDRDTSVLPPCGHRYCGTCINRLFEVATRDEALFPPQCCEKLITLDHSRRYLREEIVAAFNDVELEFSTMDRTYCSVPTCNRFIPPPDINGEKALCVACKTETCAVCKKQAHVAADCPKDHAYDSALKICKANGYQRCPECKLMIELSQGCHHIT